MNQTRIDEQEFYYNKYLKYKIKFNNLKSILENNQIGGGDFTFGLKQPWFDYIKNGSKTVEGRLNKGIFSKLKVGDNIIFISNKKLNIKTTITYIKKYPNFETMLKSETLEKVLPSVNNINEGVDIYHKYYSSADESKYGVLAFGLSTEIPQISEQLIHESKLQSPYYEYIRDGEKIYEARVNDEKRKKMNIGDTWYFKHNSDQTLPTIHTKIVGKKIYDSFADAITDIGVRQLLPQIATVDEAITIYENFDNGNYKIDAKKYGVVVFKIKVKIE